VVLQPTPSNEITFTVILRGVIALVVVVVFFLLRKTVTQAILGLIASVVGENEENKKRTTEVLSGPLSFLTAVTGVVLASFIADLPDDLALMFDNLIKSLFDLLVFWIIYSAVGPVSYVLHKTSSGTVSEDTRKVLVDLSKTLVAVAGILSALQFWGVNVAGFIAGLGLVGAAIALAAKDTFQHLFASVVMYMDHAFTKGDWVLTPSVEGIIEEVGLRTTAVRAFDTSLIHVPNAMLSGSTITNFNKCKLRRITWSLPIAGDATAEQLVACVDGIRKYLKESPAVDQTTIIVSLDKFGENCIELFVYFFLTELRWKEFQEEKERVLLRFAKIVADAGTRFGVPTRYLLLQNAQ